MKCLTRKEMIEAIKDRGSVMWQGRVIKYVNELPSEAEIATFTGDKTHQENAKNELLSQMEALKAQVSMLECAGNPGASEKNGGVGNIKTESNEVRKDGLSEIKETLKKTAVKTTE